MRPSCSRFLLSLSAHAHQKCCHIRFCKLSLGCHISWLCNSLFPTLCGCHCCQGEGLHVGFYRQHGYPHPKYWYKWWQDCGNVIVLVRDMTNEVTIISPLDGKLIGPFIAGLALWPPGSAKCQYVLGQDTECKISPDSKPKLCVVALSLVRYWVNTLNCL